MGNVSIEVSLENIWKCWFLFRRGKKPTFDIDSFEFFLEENLRRLQSDLGSGYYRHGGYRSFIVSDNKKRKVSVASVRDRVVHRILYEYLAGLYDQVFIYDVWSCRKRKGLVGAIERTQEFFRRYPSGFVWRADIRKFFDSVDHQILKRIISFRISDPLAFILLNEVIDSYRMPNRERERERE